MIHRPTTTEIEVIVRRSIERQVATTKSGKALTAYDDRLVRDLVDNIVGNLTMSVGEIVEASIEAANS